VFKVELQKDWNQGKIQELKDESLFVNWFRLVIHCFEPRKWSKVFKNISNDKIDYKDQDLIEPEEYKESIVIYNPPSTVFDSVAFHNIAKVII